MEEIIQALPQPSTLSDVLVCLGFALGFIVLPLALIACFVERDDNHG